MINNLIRNVNRSKINFKVYFFIIVICFITMAGNAQYSGLNFQAVARNSTGVIIASQQISLRFSILLLSSNGTAEYIETRILTTNAQGIFSIVIGDGTATVNLGSYATIDWKTMPKFLKVELDPSGENNFTVMGTTQLQTVPYANYSQYSANAGSVAGTNISGLVPVARGGTGASNLIDFKANLQLDNVNNTADLAKPISTLTQTALCLKLNAVDTSKFSKQTYLDSALLTKLSVTGNAATSTTAGSASTSTKLATARNINGVSFDGSIDITLTADAGTLTGTSLNSNVTRSSLTSVGTIASGTWSGTAIAINNGGTGLTAAGDDGQLLTSTSSGTLTWTTPVTQVTPVFLPTIVIGNQQWMRENLDVLTYRNGDLIPKVTDAALWESLTTGAWCYYVVTGGADGPTNGAIYGKLYNWYAVNDARGLAPQGWHIPTNADWTTLRTLLGGSSLAGGKMKTNGTNSWASPNSSATNESGFAGLPGGLRDGTDGVFYGVRFYGHWWSALENNSTNAWFAYLHSNNGNLELGYWDKRNFLSVRCLRD